MRLFSSVRTAAFWLAPAVNALTSGASISKGIASAHINDTASASLSPDDGGRIRVFDLTLTWEDHAPDGFTRKMILINRQFPGPLLEMDEGDVVHVVVHNAMPYNATMHFHGIEMEGTNWSDGVPGLTQRPIQPGRSFLYEWKATQYGSYWYHAHERGQLDDGMIGPLVIRAKKTRPRPFESMANSTAQRQALLAAERTSRPLVLSDFRHVPSQDGWAIELASGIETPCYDAVLINGQGRVDCWSAAKRQALVTPAQKHLLDLGNETSLTPKGCLPASIIANVIAAPGTPSNLSAIPPDVFDVCTPTEHALATVEVTRSASSETWTAFDVIGAFGLLTGMFAIDGHALWLYAVDGSYIEPMRVDAIPVTNGARYSVLVPVAAADGNYTIRFASTTGAQSITGFANMVVRAEDENTSVRVPARSEMPTAPVINDVGTNTSSSVVFFKQADMLAFPPDDDVRTSPAAANRTYTLGIRVAGASYSWALNHTAYPMQLDSDTPLLFQPAPAGRDNVTLTTRAGEWIDLVFQELSFPMPPHPIHKHGNKMWLIGTGDGIFPYSSVAEALQHIPQQFNMDTPPKRDTLLTPAATTGPAWMVVRYRVTNPGAWFVHCHIQSHLMGGMAVAIQDGIDQWPTVPVQYRDYV
ncbi:laccase TilA [Sporothrix brasiliensis 5110]|uniref:Laccase TilA n=1 Tax=Sporothrix brasiliensis 5110 TaxID=1398154 RepID=A0A0C2IZ92_9PEZI|nr:laccase TilA [Sporothrix brasiliensis 5110]KIH94431.1 laccase TilA [Sporothrix brasiliensis 5110]